MKYIFFYLSIILAFNCSQYGELNKVAKLSKLLDEVSGMEYIESSGLIWMHNDGSNKSELYGVNIDGSIEKVIDIKAKNHDWEDITSDDSGYMYIGDFGNNGNSRKNLAVLKFKISDLESNTNVEVEKIKFEYPKQYKFPPKKKDRYFDAESLIYFKGSLYIFTKSRVKKDYGKTDLYKIPAVKGAYKAEYISSFTTCDKFECAITGAEISDDNKTVVLLCHDKVFIFSGFKGDDFFSGDKQEHSFNYRSQKEGVTFKNSSTLFITDEKSHGKGGLLYEFNLKTE